MSPLKSIWNHSDRFVMICLNSGGFIGVVVNSPQNVPTSRGRNWNLLKIPPVVNGGGCERELWLYLSVFLAMNGEPVGASEFPNATWRYSIPPKRSRTVLYYPSLSCILRTSISFGGWFFEHFKWEAARQIFMMWHAGLRGGAQPELGNHEIDRSW